MAIFKQVVQVNGGNTGWTRGDVINALEEVFANLGWHGGTARTGAIKTITPPYYSGTSPGWNTQIPAISGIAKNDKTWSVANVNPGKFFFDQTAGDGNQTGDNIDIVCNQGDVLTFNISTATPFYIVFDNTNGYSSDKEINGDYSGFTLEKQAVGKIGLSTAVIKNIPDAQGVTEGTITWDTNDVLNGTYYYIAGDDASMTGKIIINPNMSYCDGVDLRNLKESRYNQWYSGAGIVRAYWDYTVPASGGRSEATFRIYRSNNGRIADIEILRAAETYGWSDGEEFTIPGTAVGGSSPTHDIVFGAEFSSAGPYLHVTDIGAGTQFYQKNADDGWAVLNLIHDTNKKYGNTFWGFCIVPDFFNQIRFNSGTQWEFANTRYYYDYNTSYGPGNSDWRYDYDYRWPLFNTPGFFAGFSGWDTNYDYRTLYGYHYRITYTSYCRGTNPTSYPLEIRVYKAQSPQDTNFAIIQFTQTVNEVIERYGTFFLHKGTGYGNGVFDLNQVFLGGMTFIGAGGSSNYEEIIIDTKGQMSTANYSNLEEGRAWSRARIREAFYGYERDMSANGNTGSPSRYVNNIYNDNKESPGDRSNPGYNIYYRNSSSDGTIANPGYYQYDTSTDYHRVIKGIPLCPAWIPQPYYLPDDFTLIQFTFGPGETHVRTGDVITITPSEKYEVIASAYNLNVTIPGISGSQTRGIAFCARTV